MSLAMETSAYKVDLEMFEGPLDLLLHLIRKNDVDILDIPVTLLLEQYLEYLNLLEELNIDLAGDFLLMASELTHIKSKLLLPDTGEEEQEDEVGDPRADLVRRLLEYQRYKEAAEVLVQRPMLGRDVFTQGHPPEDLDAESDPMEVDVFQLVSCFNDILKKAPQQTVHQVQVERVSVTERIYELMDRLRSEKMVAFRGLFDAEMTRERLIVTFLAVLEMTRLKLLQVQQAEICGEIYLMPVFESAEIQNLGEQVTLQ